MPTYPLPYIDYSRLKSPSQALQEARSGSLSGQLVVSNGMSGYWGVTPSTAAPQPSSQSGQSTAAQATPNYPQTSSTIAPEVPPGCASFLVAGNNQIASLLPPFYPVIDTWPNPPYYQSFAQDFKERPIDALLLLFKPVENMLADAVRNANQFSGIATRRVGLPGVYQTDVVMGLTVPSQITDQTVSRFIWRLKLVLNFMILGFYDPINMARGIAETLRTEGQAGLQVAEELIQQAKSMGISLAGIDQASVRSAGFTMPSTADAMNKWLRSLVTAFKAVLPSLPSLQAVAAQAAQAAQKAADDAAKKVRVAVDNLRAQAAGLQQAAKQLAQQALTEPNPLKKADLLRQVADLGKRATALLDQAAQQLAQAGLHGAHLSGFGALPVIAAGGAAGAGTTAASIAAVASTPLDASLLSAVIVAVIAYVIDNPDKAAALVATGEKVASQATTTAATTASTAANANHPAPRPAAPAKGNPLVTGLLAAGAIVAFPVVGPAAGIALAAGAAYNALKK